MKQIRLLIGFIILITSLNCNETRETKDTKQDKQADPHKKMRLALKKAFKYNLKTDDDPARVGDVVHLDFELATDTFQIDSLQVYIDNNLRQSMPEIPGSLSLETKEQAPGKKVVVAALNTPYGRVVKQRALTLLSDIQPVKMTYDVIETFPHDKGAFTQGFLYHNGFLYEATGLKGESSVRKVVLNTGDVLQSYAISRNIFGEGIAIHKGKIIQLSWRARKGFVYNLKTFERLDEFHYSSEGWGLTSLNGKLVMSDGSNVLKYLDVNAYNMVGRIEVFDFNGPVEKLNELEYINGAIYANIYTSDVIVKIEPRTGKVLARIDMKGLLSPEDYHNEIDVLNGIAYDAKGNRILVTGKRWPKVYHVSFEPVN